MKLLPMPSLTVQERAILRTLTRQRMAVYSTNYWSVRGKVISTSGHQMESPVAMLLYRKLVTVETEVEEYKFDGYTEGVLWHTVYPYIEGDDRTTRNELL